MHTGVRFTSNEERDGKAMIRVLLAEDQAMVRGALVALLKLAGDIEIVAEVGRGDQVVEAARSIARLPCTDTDHV
jgi:CheY-like chemotaxis protein